MCLCVSLCVSMCETFSDKKEFFRNLKGNKRDRDIEDVDHISITDKIEDIIIPDFLLKFRVNTAMTASMKQNKDLDINP